MLTSLEHQMREMLARLNRPDPDFAFATTPRNDGGPHVEGKGPVFEWVHTERSVTLSRIQVTGAELLFLAMDSLTAELAQQAELRARGTGPQSRWRWMDAHIRLMRRLDPAWGQRLAARYDKLLSIHPLRADEAMAGLAPLDLSAFGVD